LRRRHFIVGLCGAAVVLPRAGLAQAPNRLRRVGVLMHHAETDAGGQARVAAFRGGFEKLGWSDGRNVRIDVRWAAGNPDLAQRYAAELTGLNPEVVLTGNTEVSKAIQRATQTIPMVFAEVIDPIAYGLVAGLAQPGGNVTGFMMFETPLAAKWLELLKQIAPGVDRVAVIYDPSIPSTAGFLATIEAAAPSFAVQVSSSAVRSSADIKRFFDTLGDTANLGSIELPGSIMAVNRNLIIGLAAAHRLPMIYGLRDNPANGGLASYGVNSVELYRQAASYVDRILKGETPGSLPVQAATRFELVINLKTARALGIEVPPTLLGRADEVIE
jgi:ABC-type uncharacterized transport system substrate-binding protein